MKDSIEKTEHYALFHLKETQPIEAAFDQLLNAAGELLETSEYVYFIFDLNLLSTTNDGLLDALFDFSERLVNKNGLLLSVHANPSFLHVFEDKQLVLVPKVEEAVEYIYMDQLEKQFLGDNDD